MREWFSGDAVGFDYAAKSVPGPSRASTGAARVKVVQHVESSRAGGGCSGSQGCNMP